MKPGVLAIAIDGPNTSMLDQWIDSGKLPVIRSLMANGVAGRHVHTKRFRNERCWDILLSGKDIITPGSTFEPGTYEYYNESPQRQHRYSPFYALGSDYKICMFDLPARMSENVNGFQVFGWGSELNVSVPQSSPAELIREIEALHGTDPKLTQSIKVLDHKSREKENSYVIPNLYDDREIQSYQQKLLTSVNRRTEICLDLLGREDWDLFLLNFPETHTANHLLWHVGEDHPISDGTQKPPAMLEICRAIDESIGRLIAAMPNGSTAVIFTIDNTAVNSMDVPSMAMLPELLYRWNFPGDVLLAPGKAGAPVPPIRRDYRELWKHEMWALVTGKGLELLESPRFLESSGHPLSWNPAAWYRKLWPSMKAFALPSVSDGYVRLNIRGREASGLVDISDYHRTLESVSAMLQSLTNPRTGKPAVKALTRIRDSAFDCPEIPPDLIVSWNDESPADSIDSLDFGRIGPLPYFRTGGHLSYGSLVEGIFAAQGPGILHGARTRTGKLEDIPATILALLGATPSSEMTGKSLLE